MDARDSRERFHVGPHHTRDATNARVLEEFVWSTAALFEAIAQSPDSDVGADLVPELEAVRHGLRCAVDAYGNALDDMRFDARIARLARDAHDPQTRAVRSWRAVLLPDGEPYLEWRLRGEFVEAQRRKEADHPSWDSLRNFGERAVFARRGASQGVEASPHPIKFPTMGQPREIAPRDPCSLQVSRPDYARLAHQVENGVCRHGNHEQSMPAMQVVIKNYLHIQRALPL